MPRPSWPRQDAAEGIEDAGDGEGGDLHPRDRDAGERRQLLAAAERIDVAAEAGVVLDRARRRRTHASASQTSQGKPEEALDGQAADHRVVDADCTPPSRALATPTPIADTARASP